jgi:hypothetical protein
MSHNGWSGSSDEQKTRVADRQAAERLRQLELDTELNGFLAAQLAGFYDRDIALVQERIDAIEEALGDAALGVARLFFGGSVAKNTYVDGLSDVDALVILDEPEAPPHDLIGRFTVALRGRLGSGDVLDISEGRLATTVTYRDHSQVQLLPAVERDGRTLIAAADGESWRDIRPHEFIEKLTQIDQANGRAVIPTIKLAKAAIARLPRSQQLSGYHVEAIAADAFKDYSGCRDRVSTLRHLIEYAVEAVLRPTGDITGQSVHIDAHLGPADSAERLSVSISLRRLVARLINATSVSDYRDLFYD